MDDITFIRTGNIKGFKVWIYRYNGATGKTVKITTERGTIIHKTFQKSPYFFATLSPIVEG